MDSKKLLITDLDNTLYNWVSYFALSFEAMVTQLHAITGITADTLLKDFRKIHRKYHDSEHPFSALELPSVTAAFPGFSRSELKEAIDPAFHAFNSARKSHLILYPKVKETLQKINDAGYKIVGHTEATTQNAVFRLRKLSIIDYFDRVYALKPP